MKIFLKNQFKFSVFDITLAAFFVALNVISEKFISIKIPGLMSIGITYVWYILMGLTMKPFLAIVTYIASDLINTGTSSFGFVGYMWEYPVMYIGLILFVSIFKLMLKIKNGKVYWSLIALLNLGALLFTTIFLIFKKDFEFTMLTRSGKVSKNTLNAAHNMDLSDQTAQIVIWIMVSLALATSILMFTIYYFKRSAKLKTVILIYTIVILIVVIFNWIFEPLVYIKMLERYNSGTSYSDFYSTYLTARVAKSPFLFVLYTTIAAPLYLVTKQLNKNELNKW